MSSKTEKDKIKQLQDKCQSVLNALLRDEDNKYCVDCDSKGPRWASWNLGVFLCIRCAGIHRNLGVHISKVKSVNLDAWTPEQVVSLQQMGNSRARAVYEANLPDNFRRPQNDSSLETFIRAKYEHKKYIAREWVPPSLPEVNWEKEIDEEIDRLKRKKKTVLERKSLGSMEVPQLPKPKNSSPKINRIQAPPQQPSPQPLPAEDKLNTDLLGLQNGDDNFSSFLSAPVSATTNSNSNSEKKPDAVDPAKSEEESFFNQTMPTEKEKAKLTKDSILALYGSSAPVNNFTTYTTNAAPQPNFPNFGQYPQQQQFQYTQFPAAPFPPNQVQMNNQFQMPPQNYQHQNQPQFMQNAPPFQMNQFPPTSQQGTFQTQPPNPFYNQTGNLQQQFGNMSLNGPNGTPTPSLWQ